MPFTSTNADSIHRNRTSSCKISRTWKSKRARKKPPSPVNLSNPMPNSNGSRTNWRSSMATSIISKMRATSTNSFYTMSNWKMAESTLWNAMVSNLPLGCMLKVGFQLIGGLEGGLCTYINMKEVLVKAAVRKYKITIALHPSALNFVHFPLRPCSQTPNPMV